MYSGRVGRNARPVRMWPSAREIVRTLRPYSSSGSAAGFSTATAAGS